MAIYLRIGTPDQEGWINLTGAQGPDGRFEVLIKPGVVLDAAKLEVLNGLNTESDTSVEDRLPIAGTG